MRQLRLRVRSEDSSVCYRFSVIIPRMKFVAFAFISGVGEGSAKDIAGQFALVLPSHRVVEREECTDGGGDD